MDVNEIEVLLVEDNPQDAELTMRALKTHNLTNRMLHVKDGAEAIEYFFGNGRYANHNPNITPKVVLLDLRLPKVDGIEVLRRLRGDERTRLVPVVVLTSSQEESDRVESYKLGVNSFVVKPVGFESFSDAVVKLGLYWLLINKPPK